MIYKFNTTKAPELSQVGGKAKALIETSKAGFPVPQGIVLSVAFFKPWLKMVKSSHEWDGVMKDTSKENCDLLVEKALTMTFDKRQLAAFQSKLEGLTGEVFAVRSSSPEEDLENTSFAGMYETFLGVPKDGLEKAVSKAFASGFSYRVMSYKKQKGLSLEGTSIAIIVQRQIASDISGVGFSLNPLNNAYDEVVINASFGLGESIVSGMVTPDTYIVDTVKDKIMKKKINEKQIAILLGHHGGTQKVQNDQALDQALSNEQILELSQLIKNCESHYDFPIDIEWAYESDVLYLLQARPITTYLPLFPELLTKPEDKKKIYIDIMAMTQGFDDPMSVLGLEIWGQMLDRIKGGMMTPQVGGTAPAIHGKQYISVTDIQKVMGKRGLNQFLNSYDGNIKRIFQDIGDIGHLLPDEKPAGTEDSKKRLAKLMLSMVPAIFKSLFFNHQSVIGEYEKLANQLVEKAKNLRKEDDFDQNVEVTLESLTTLVSSASAMMAGMLAQLSIKRMFKDDQVDQEIVALAMDLQGNPTSEMGHLLFKMASSDDFKAISSRNNFIKQAQARAFSPELLKDYDEFMHKFSARGFMEIDVASKRIDEDLGLLYDKLIQIDTKDNQMTKVKEKRQLAYDKLLGLAKAKGQEKKFLKRVTKYQETFGYREHPKYMIIQIFAQFHYICLDLASDWVAKGRLDHAYDIFDLHIAEIAKAQKDPSLDLRKLRQSNLAPYNKVAHIKNWPLVIDSRGKIYKPKLAIEDGQIKGDAIAPGKVVGKAKVLRRPYEKPLEAGEILVARATEPSWTPIFTNAAGVIMEIGGPLQHGGIIAREYGIPCVSGLIGIMDLVKDGDLIEVDGDHGFVKINFVDNQ